MSFDEKIEHQIEHFDSVAEEYYLRRTGEKQIYLNNLIYAELFDGINFGKDKLDVLEPMCGYGEGKRIIDIFIKNNVDYEGFDYSKKIVELAKKYNPDANIFLSNVVTFSTNKNMIL